MGLRKTILSFIADFANWDHSSDPHYLEMLTQPGAGNLLLLHEDPEDLAQADQFRLRASITAHRVFPPILKEKIMVS